VTLLVMLRKRGIYQPNHDWLRFFLKIIPALAALAAVLLLADRYIDWISLGATPLLRVLYLGGVLLASGISYFGMLFIVGIRPSYFTKRA
jgi:putative peptidoglycan lipid II flippase